VESIVRRASKKGEMSSSLNQGRDKRSLEKNPGWIHVVIGKGEKGGGEQPSSFIILLFNALQEKDEAKTNGGEEKKERFIWPG